MNVYSFLTYANSSRLKHHQGHNHGTCDTTSWCARSQPQNRARQLTGAIGTLVALLHLELCADAPRTRKHDIAAYPAAPIDWLATNPMLLMTLSAQTFASVTNKQHLPALRWGHLLLWIHDVCLPLSHHSCKGLHTNPCSALYAETPKWHAGLFLSGRRNAFFALMALGSRRPTPARLVCILAHPHHGHKSA